MNTNKGINLSYLNRDIDPADDFYSFVNGGWMETVEIPEDRSSWGSFHELSKETDKKILNILENELAIPGQATNIAARLFESGMDTAHIQESKLEAIASQLQSVAQLKTLNELPYICGKLMKAGLGSLMPLSVHPDLGNSKIYAAYLEPVNLGLPEREYYLDQNDKSAHVREEYKKYITELLIAAAKDWGNNAVEWSSQILKLETTLAEKMMTKEDRRDIAKLYNPIHIDTLKSTYSNWNWDDYFLAAEMEIPAQLIVTDVTYFDFFNSFIKDTNLEIIKAYLAFMLVHHAAPFVHSAIEEEFFNLYGKTIEGIKVMRPRNERIVKIINSYLGEALGALFVSKYFPPAAKQNAIEMVDDIIAAYQNRIHDLDWMSASTKQYAQEKLRAVTIKIGYPDIWETYEGLNITSSQKGKSYLANVMSAAAWKREKDIRRIGKEVDKAEWFMAPQVVNAYYNPLFNEIVFPAAILQPPFFDWEADAAVNYGGIGAVIGHEITHGFDDQGSRFDKEGNYNEWWTEEDREKFNAHTRQLIEQFDNYYPFEDLALNGTFTLGENIADLGGLSVAFDALQRYFMRHGRPEKVDGFTPEQRFFMSWATVWRTKTRPEALRNQVKTDPHPPGRYRAVAAPSNMSTFYSAFGEKTSSPWYRNKENRIKIW